MARRAALGGPRERDDRERVSGAGVADDRGNGGQSLRHRGKFVAEARRPSVCVRGTCGCAKGLGRSKNVRRPSSLETRFRRVIGDICGAGLGRTVLLHGPWLASLCRRRRPRVKTAAKARAQPRPTWPPRCAALVREEQAGRRPRRLLEPSLATWHRFRGRLELQDLVGTSPRGRRRQPAEPFDVARFSEAPPRRCARCRTAQVSDWLAEFAALSADIPDRDYIEQQAKRLGLKARPAFSDLHKLAPHHRVLGPGSGGRLAAHAVFRLWPGSR